MNCQLFIAGPCVIETMDCLEEVARELVRINGELGTDIIFKASFDKANRTSIQSYRGPGMERGLQMLADIKQKYGLRLLTDIHEAWQAAPVAEVVDVLQIPAFLCRQTDLLVAAAKTGKTVNIKKAQFLSGQDMKWPVQKVKECAREGAWCTMHDARLNVSDDGGDNHASCIVNREPEVWLTERGTTFGYNNLVVDFRNIPEMQAFGFPVVMDVTHSLQRPNQASGVTGGVPRFIDTIASAAIAVGADGLFIETHPRPSEALSDGANMLRLDLMEPLLTKMLRLRRALID